MDKKQTKIPLIMRFTPTDIDFADYHTLEELVFARNKVRDRKYTVKNTEEDYRVINYWDECGVLPDGMESRIGEWRKFSFIEIVWIEVVKKLRNFGVPLEKIAEANKNVMEWNEKWQTYPDFEFFVMKAWIGKMDPYVLMLEDGRADVGSIEEIELSKNSHGQSMLLISLKEILESMGYKTQAARKLLDLTDAEREVLGKMRLENNNEIKVKLKDTGHIEEIESVKNYTENPPMQEINSEMRKDEAFGEVITKYEHGKRQSTKLVKRKRIKNKAIG